MATFFQKLFSKDDIIDHDKITDQAILSFERSRFDTELFLIYTNRDLSNEKYLEYVKRSLAISKADKIRLGTEVDNLLSYISFFKETRVTSFFYKVETKGLENAVAMIPSFLLVPLIKNAFYYGYNTMNNYPVRIRIYLSNYTLKLEVSNRVNHHLENQEGNDEIRWFKARLQQQYPDGYTLLFNSNSNLFKATLILDLK